MHTPDTHRIDAYTRTPVNADAGVDVCILRTPSVTFTYLALTLIPWQLAGGSAPAPNTVQFELSNETLRAVLEGLGKIRDQLNAVNQQS